MKNVYEQVRLFYEDVEWEPAVKREWIEGYLRQKAWQGLNDEQLSDIWFQLQMFAVYLAYSGNEYLDELERYEFSAAVEWMINHVPNFKRSVKYVRRFFEILQSFYEYLQSKKMIDQVDELKEAAKIIAGGKKLQFIPLEEELFFSEIEGEKATVRDTGTAMTVQMAQRIGAAVEGLMLKLGTHFQKEEFHDDFERALFLYNGPFQSVPDANQEQDDYWLGFWDYFLFDYHLIVTDSKPLEHFRSCCTEVLKANERQVLEELATAQFTIFYVDTVLDAEWVECVNLISGETFQLPHPDLDYSKIKRQLFFGHVFSQDRLILNYVTTIEVSVNLRRRMKEEIIRLKMLYDIQQPGATWQDFFSRHALVVRHTIDVLAAFARVNVIDHTQVERTFPKITEQEKTNTKVTDALHTYMPEFGFSAHDRVLAAKLWHDFCQLTSGRIRDILAWAGAVMYAYSQINTPSGVKGDLLAEKLDISAESLYRNRSKIFRILALKKYDPRYISEEGFMFFLFEP